MKEDTEVVDIQQKDLDDLNKLIAEEEKKVKDLEDRVKPAREEKKKLEEHNRILMQTNNTSKAKKKWIEETYNYTENVEKMDVDMFAKIVKTNEEVNKQIGEFNVKLAEVQKDFNAVKARAMAT